MAAPVLKVPVVVMEPDPMVMAPVPCNVKAPPDESVKEDNVPAALEAENVAPVTVNVPVETAENVAVALGAENVAPLKVNVPKLAVAARTSDHRNADVPKGVVLSVAG